MAQPLGCLADLNMQHLYSVHVVTKAGISLRDNLETAELQ